MPEQDVLPVLLGFLIGLIVATLIGAVILRAATAWVTKIHIEFGLACGITLVIAFVGFLINLPLSFMKLAGVPETLTTLPAIGVSFLVSMVLVGLMVKDESGTPVGAAKGALITLVEYAIGLVIALLIGAVVYAGMRI